MGSWTALFMEEENQCCRQLIFLCKTCGPSSNLRPPKATCSGLWRDLLSLAMKWSNHPCWWFPTTYINCSHPCLLWVPAAVLSLIVDHFAQSRIPGRHSVQSHRQLGVTELYDPALLACPVLPSCWCSTKGKRWLGHFYSTCFCCCFF